MPSGSENTVYVSGYGKKQTLCEGFGLQIEAYFEQIQKIIDDCPVIQSSNMTYDKRGTHEGFLRGEISFADESILHLREFVDVETSIDRLTYVYQYMNPAKKLVFRYDNTGHGKKSNIPTHPHHKHEGSEDNIASSLAPDLAAVLNEIEALVQLP